MSLENLILEIRQQFYWVDECPLTGKRVYLENAGGALTLKTVVEASAKFAAIPDNIGRPNEASTALERIISRGKRDMFDFFGVEHGEVFVGETGTELLFRLIGAVIASDKSQSVVVGSTLEHPATRSACAHWSKRLGARYIQIEHDVETGLVTPGAYAHMVTPDTRVATVLHTSPITGMGVDLPAIAQAIRTIAPDCYIIVDGIQHAAHGSVDLSSYGVDAYVISPYKVFSRHGYGIAWISPRLAGLPHCHLEGSAQSNWELGTRDVGAFATFSEVVSYLDWLGGTQTDSQDRRARLRAAGAAIKEHEALLVDRILNGAGNLKGLISIEGLALIGSAAAQAREGLVSFTIESREALDIVELLEARGIRTHLRKNDYYSGNILQPLGIDACVRASVCHYNTIAEIDRFLLALHDILAA